MSSSTIREELEYVNAEIARRSLQGFAMEAWPFIEPGTPLRWNWHLTALCRVLEQVTNGELKLVPCTA